MRWPWWRDSKSQSASERALTETERKVRQAREMRIAAEAQAAAERRYLLPRLAGDEDIIAARIVEGLRRRRHQ
jgi:hypothetical protein